MMQVVIAQLSVLLAHVSAHREVVAYQMGRNEKRKQVTANSNISEHAEVKDGAVNSL